MTRRRDDQGTMRTFRATAVEVRDGSAITSWLLAAADRDAARERAREQAARRGFADDVFVRVEPVEDREAGTIYRATVTDTISREQVGGFAFSADSIEEARERGWRIAGRRYGNDIDVRVERASK
jgi:hypothetical protein